MATKEGELSTFVKGKNFVQDSIEELKKVHTPTRQETTQATIVVFIMVFIFSMMLGLIDLIWSYIMSHVLA